MMGELLMGEPWRAKAFFMGERGSGGFSALLMGDMGSPFEALTKF